jgi:predicted nucleotidyltransferase
MKRVLREIAKELSKMESIRAVILYGSFARGEYTPRSDIDLLILTTDKKTQKEIQDRIIVLESKTNRSIQPTIRTINQLKKTDTGLLQNIFQEGKILYIKEPEDIPSAALLQQKPYLIYVFRMSGLGQKDKAKFNKCLYGQKVRRYDYQGVLKQIGGKKLSAGCVIVPYIRKGEIEKLFRKFKVEFEPFKVWK